MYTYYFLRNVVYEVLNCYEKLQNIEAEDGKSWQNTSMDRHLDFSSVSNQNNTVCLQAWRAERAVKAYRKASPQLQIHITIWKMVNICILIWSNSSLAPQDKKIVIQLVNVCAST